MINIGRVFFFVFLCFLKYIFVVWIISILNIEVYLFIYNMWEDIEYLFYGVLVKIEEVNK